MINTYDEHNPNNPINEIECEAELVDQNPECLFDAVGECDEIFTDKYFEEIITKLNTLADFAGQGENVWLKNELLKISKLVKN